MAIAQISLSSGESIGPAASCLGVQVRMLSSMGRRDGTPHTFLSIDIFPDDAEALGAMLIVAAKQSRRLMREAAKLHGR